MKLVNIKEKLKDKEILTILAESTYMPTKEKLNARAEKYMNDDRIIVYPIVNVKEVIEVLHNNPVDGKVYIDDEMKAKMEAYLEEYCVK